MAAAGPVGASDPSTGIGYQCAFNLDYSHVHSRDLILKTHKTHHKQEQIGVRNRHQAMTLGLSYYVMPQLNLNLRIPFVDNQRVKRAQGVKYEVRGLGDIALDARYWFREPLGDAWNFYALLGLTLPTGEDDYDSGTAESTKPYMQAGSGVWTPSVGVGCFKRFGDLTWTADTSWAWPLGESDADYDAASPWFASTGVAYLIRFSSPSGGITDAGEGAPAAPASAGIGPWISLGLSLNSLYIQSHGKVNDIRVGNTGGWWLRLEPRIEVSPDGKGFSAYVALPFPVYAEVNSLQCIEDYGINFGVSYRF